MTRVVWTPEAISRLDDIEAYIALDSPANAKEVIARLLARTRQLEKSGGGTDLFSRYTRVKNRDRTGTFHAMLKQLGADGKGVRNLF